MKEQNAIHFHVATTNEAEKLRPDSIVSQSLLQNDHTKVVRFSFSRGQELSEHTATVAAMLHQLSGTCRWVLGEEIHEAKPGDWVYMPPNLKHSLQASEDCAVLLILLKKTG